MFALVDCTNLVIVFCRDVFEELVVGKILAAKILDR